MHSMVPVLPHSLRLQQGPEQYVGLTVLTQALLLQLSPPTQLRVPMSPTPPGGPQRKPNLPTMSGMSRSTQPSLLLQSLLRQQTSTQKLFSQIPDAQSAGWPQLEPRTLAPLGRLTVAAGTQTFAPPVDGTQTPVSHSSELQHPFEQNDASATPSAAPLVQNSPVSQRPSDRHGCPTFPSAPASRAQPAAPQSLQVPCTHC